MSSTAYHNTYNLQRYHTLRAKYLSFLGGCCVVCGSVEKLHFDHIQFETKSFSICDNITYPEQLVMEELKKCQLLCQKCHISKTRKSKDGYSKRAKGEAVSSSKLTVLQVLEIREVCNSMTLLELAAKYSVTRKSITNIIQRSTWKHI